VQCADVLLGRFGPDCALRQWALARIGTSRGAKKRTIVAVARKLAVLLHRLWSRQEVFQPFPCAAVACMDELGFWFWFLVLDVLIVEV
jgi:hypothetical protein